MLFPVPALAGPIYVYREKSGAIRFSTKAPPAGVRAEIFTAKGASFSTSRATWSARGPLFRTQYHDILEGAAKTNQVELALLKAVVHVESAFNPAATSPKGAKGLMQLMPATASVYGVKHVTDPAENVRAGSKHLAGLIRKYDGSLTLALAAYNAGEEAVSRYGGVPPYTETKDYVRRVLQLKARYAQSVLG